MDRDVVIMPCLDMRDGRVVKGVRFVDIKDAGDPVQCALAYCRAGADELAMLDITATVEKRRTMIDVVRRVADVVTVPFTVGGGVGDVATAAAVLEAGADRVSISSAAFRDRELVPRIVRELGPKVTVAIDVDRSARLPSGYEVYIDGGRTPTGFDAVEFARTVDGWGVPVILPTSKAGDGTRSGYDLPIIRKIAEATSAAVGQRSMMSWTFSGAGVKVRVGCGVAESAGAIAGGVVAAGNAGARKAFGRLQAAVIQSSASGKTKRAIGKRFLLFTE